MRNVKENLRLEVIWLKPKIKLTLVERRGEYGCHRGHKVGDTFDFDTERGKLCPMAMHVAFPYVDILRYGGKVPKASNEK